MLKEIRITDSICGYRMVEQSKDCTWGCNPITIPNRKVHLKLEFIEMQVRTFSAVILEGPRELIGVHVWVDWCVLNETLKSARGLVWQAFPLQIEDEFIWKEKGHIKLCYA